MNIVIPFDSETFFTLEDKSLMSLLNLEPANVLDEALTHWNKFTKGDAVEIFEQAVEDMQELISLSLSGCELDRAEEILEANGNQLADLVKTSALRLKDLVHEIPDELERTLWTNDDNEHGQLFLRVSEIDPIGKFAIIKSDTVYL